MAAEKSISSSSSLAFPRLIRRVADELDIEKQQLAELAHVHRNTVSRMPRSPQLQKFLRESIRVLAAATDFNGSSKKAAFWFRNQPIADFGYRTAEALVSEGRADDVLRYIEILDAGSAG
ncbi:MAG TPA: hypothetical protein VGN07_07685 [Steroidobacteraceae bacterium]|jgi:uncharacterized protein (DUF2384 family)